MKKHPPPMKAVRQHCLDCCLGQAIEVKMCGAAECPSFPLRFGKKVEGLNVLKTIKAHCIQCGGCEEPPRDCQVIECALWPFRTGHNPNRAGLGGNLAALTAWKEKTQTERASAEKMNSDTDPGSSSLEMPLSPQNEALNSKFGGIAND